MGRRAGSAEADRAGRPRTSGSPLLPVAVRYRHRQAFLRHLGERGIQAAFHYQPLHGGPGGRRYGRTAPGGCEVTEDVADRLVRLLLFSTMSYTVLDHVLAAVASFARP